MAGPGDALAQEGRNMQKGLQDAHDLWMGQRPDGQYEVHSVSQSEELNVPDSGPQTFSQYEQQNEPLAFGPANDNDPVLSGANDNDPLAFGPAAGPSEEPEISSDTYMAPTYDPTVGPAEQNDPLTFGPDESAASYDPPIGPDADADWGPAYDPEFGPDAANDEPAFGPDPQEPDM